MVRKNAVVAVVGKTAKTKKAIVALTEESKDIEIFEGLIIPAFSNDYVHGKHDNEIRKEKHHGNQNL